MRHATFNVHVSHAKTFGRGSSRASLPARIHAMAACALPRKAARGYCAKCWRPLSRSLSMDLTALPRRGLRWAGPGCTRAVRDAAAAVHGAGRAPAAAVAADGSEGTLSIDGFTAAACHATCCGTAHHAPTQCNMLQHAPTQCNMLQRSAPDALLSSHSTVPLDSVLVCLFVCLFASLNPSSRCAPVPRLSLSAARRVLFCLGPTVGPFPFLLA